MRRRNDKDSNSKKHPKAYYSQLNLAETKLHGTKEKDQDDLKPSNSERKISLTFFPTPFIDRLNMKYQTRSHKF